MADEEIRRVVREELELNLVSRTRNLIRSAASSASRLGESITQSSTPSSLSTVAPRALTSGTSSTNNKRPFPATGKGHWMRTKKAKPIKIQSVPKSVWLLERPRDDVEISDAGIYEDDSVCK